MINPATGLEMTFAETLTSVEYVRICEERYHQDHPANAVWSDSELIWVTPASTAVEIAPPVETPIVQAE
jgi:hypothetical protein